MRNLMWCWMRRSRLGRPTLDSFVISDVLYQLLNREHNYAFHAVFPMHGHRPFGKMPSNRKPPPLMPVVQGCPHGQPWSFNPAGASQRTGLLAASTAGIPASLFERRSWESQSECTSLCGGLFLSPTSTHVVQTWSLSCRVNWV